MVNFKKLLAMTDEERKELSDMCGARIAEKVRVEHAKITDLCSIDSGLSDWELGFVESVAGAYSRDGHLSEKQWLFVDKILKAKGGYDE